MKNHEQGEVYVFFLVTVNPFCRYQSLRRTIRGVKKTKEQPRTIPESSLAASENLRQAVLNPSEGRSNTRTVAATLTTTSSTTHPPHTTTTAITTTATTTAAISTTTNASPTLSSSNENSASQIDRRESQAVFNYPGCLFIRRKDFFQFVNSHNVGSLKL